MASQRTIKSPKKSFPKRAWNWLKPKVAKISGVFWLSLIGGVPGGINIINWYRDKPEFGFHGLMFFDGLTDAAHPESKYFMLSGAIYNDGNKPLFPISFKLTIKFKEADSTLVLNSFPMIDSLSVHGEDKNKVIVFKNQADLLKIVRINSNDALYGALFFPAINRQYDWNDIESRKLTCIDILNLERTVELNNLRPPARGQYVSLPKSGSMYYDSTK
jgi:hypothetical protein